MYSDNNYHEQSNKNDYKFEKLIEMINRVSNVCTVNQGMLKSVNE